MSFDWPDDQQDELREVLQPLSDAIKERNPENPTEVSADKGAFTPEADYIAISTLVECCEPWIDLWGGDEWGENMRNLAGACHTDYGFSDQDCALFAGKLLENLIAQKEWMDDEGRDYGLSEPDEEARVRAEAREKRDYWLKGGNLGDWADSPAKAKAVVDKLPRWMFNDAQEKLFDEPAG